MPGCSKYLTFVIQSRSRHGSSTTGARQRSFPEESRDNGVGPGPLFVVPHRRDGWIFRLSGCTPFNPGFRRRQRPQPSGGQEACPLLVRHEVHQARMLVRTHAPSRSPSPSRSRSPRGRRRQRPQPSEEQGACPLPLRQEMPQARMLARTSAPRPLPLRRGVQ